MLTTCLASGFWSLSGVSKLLSIAETGQKGGKAHEKNDS